MSLNPKHSNPSSKARKPSNNTMKSSLSQDLEESSPSYHLWTDQNDPNSNFQGENSQDEYSKGRNTQVESQTKKLFFYKALMTCNFFASVGNVLVSDIDTNKAEWMIACWAWIQFKMALSGVKERSESKIERALVLMKFYLVLMGILMLGKMYGETTTIERDGRRVSEFSFDFGIFLGELLRIVVHLIFNIWSTMEILKVLRSLNLKDKEGKVDDLKRELDTWPLIIYRCLVYVFYFWNILRLIAFIWNEYSISPSQFLELRRQCRFSLKSIMACLEDSPLGAMKYDQVLTLSTIEHIFILPMLIRSMSFIYKGIETKGLSKVLDGIRWLKAYLAAMSLLDVFYHVVWLKNGTLMEMYKVQYPGGHDLEPIAKLIVMLTFSLLCRGMFYYALMFGALKARGILSKMREKSIEKLIQEPVEKVEKMSLFEELDSWPYRGYKYGILIYFCWNMMNLISSLVRIYSGLDRSNLERFLEEIMSDRYLQYWLISEIVFGSLKCLFSFFLFEGMRKKDLKKILIAIKLIALEIVSQFLFSIAKETLFHKDKRWSVWVALSRSLPESLFYALVYCVFFLFGAIKVRNILKAPKDTL